MCNDYQVSINHTSRLQFHLPTREGVHILYDLRSMVNSWVQDRFGKLTHLKEIGPLFNCIIISYFLISYHFLFICFFKSTSLHTFCLFLSAAINDRNFQFWQEKRVINFLIQINQILIVFLLMDFMFTNKLKKIFWIH